MSTTRPTQEQYEDRFGPYNPDTDESENTTTMHTDTEQRDTFDCPRCGEVDVVSTDSPPIPSMLGYGTDDVVQLACGHTITFDPFNGRPMVHRERTEQTQSPIPECPLCGLPIARHPGLVQCDGAPYIADDDEDNERPQRVEFTIGVCIALEWNDEAARYVIADASITDGGLFDDATRGPWSPEDDAWIRVGNDALAAASDRAFARVQDALNAPIPDAPLSDWWCHRCDRDFAGYEHTDGTPPPCPQCKRTDDVEADETA